MTDTRRFRHRGVDDRFLTAHRTNDSAAFHLAGNHADSPQSHALQSPTAIRSAADLNRAHRAFWTYERSIAHG